MSGLQPANTRVRDLCQASLRMANVIGVGQTALAEDAATAQEHLQWMLQEWERKRWLVYHLVQLSVTSTGAQAYSIGPGGDMDTNAFALPFGSQFGQSARPNRVEYAFLRQLTQSQPNQIDYPLEQLQAREDYDKIALKQLQSFPGYFFYDSAWPLGYIYAWPVPQANIYALHVTVREQLPVAFANQATPVSLPYEYYNAIVMNLAIRLRARYGIPSFQGDPLPGLAKDALNALRAGNAQIPRLQTPADLARPLIYNIFSDRMY